MGLYRNAISCLAISLFTYSGFAQKKSFAGVILDSATLQPIGLASIRNVMSGVTVISKKDGSFVTDITPGQVLAFSANGYYTDTITITSKILETGKFTRLLRFLPSTLADVTITGKYNEYQNDSIQRRKQFLQTVGENKIPAVSRVNANDMGFGVGINLDHFDKKEKNKRKARSLFEITEEEAYINYRWNDTLVKKYTSFSGDQLTNFMQRSRPLYDWLRNHTGEEDLLYYINSQLKKMKKEG